MRIVPQEIRINAKSSQPTRHPWQQFRPGLAVFAALLLGGCGTAVEIRQPFPAPLVEQLPLRAAIVYPASMADYVHHETDAARQEWTVRLGNANVRMFDAVFAALFREAVPFGDIEAARAGMPAADVILAPTIDAFELSSPAQSATDQFAVWIRYNLDVLAPDGALIVRWPVTAYGQCGIDGMSDERSVERATMLALRDAAATIAVGFASQPQIRKTLAKELP